jgi:hypothetical protein
MKVAAIDADSSAVTTLRPRRASRKALMYQQSIALDA